MTVLPSSPNDKFKDRLVRVFPGQFQLVRLHFGTGLSYLDISTDQGCSAYSGTSASDLDLRFWILVQLDFGPFLGHVDHRIRATYLEAVIGRETAARGA